ncbi:MAG: lytic murein transglycosylase B [Gammaproteobacteria bacterium]|jgi:membrane-bound lytic murein transglycosylase B|nr:lytic murein transglycosylase B [Gammaproteobacteria bacterium]MDH3887491.1 lytic murein transglycosylase B [Gammaproteobacteria bacterium]MDH3935426.1 lytic murein transglycosylase B [Gammaproteobacteria bacterium]MDH3972433.1 lytic murein transglycosylase B [Gammaproteobacteria bacterium]MDH3985774.1 lytic murein transglycosylase B [Gammaproteobacteria bacterium]
MRLQTIKKGLSSSFLLASLFTVTTVAASNYSAQPQVQVFIDRMVSEQGFDRNELIAVLDNAERREDILELMRKPAEKRLQWYEYRKIFLTQSRIDGGVNFWKENAGLLKQAAEAFGVAPQIIVAIIGVETRYGSNTGRHRVLDALATLSFDYPPRSQFFTGELEQYLILAREEDIDILTTTGSYAGAMGYGQFIPSSYRHYAVDFDEDGKRDLWTSKADIIGSVANYFKEHGWTAGMPVAVLADVQGDDYQKVLDIGYKPNTVLDAMRHDGITPRTPLPDELLAALIAFEQENGPEYWLGFNNFYAITRYNHSPLYAMAVYQLSEEIRDAYETSRHNND